MVAYVRGVTFLGGILILLPALNAVRSAFVWDLHFISRVPSKEAGKVPG